MANPFINRIVGYNTKPADQFLANPMNYRTHPQRQRDAVQASLRELGWIGVVVENRTTGRLIDGHERVWQALKQNEHVPFIEVELSEEEERLALAIFDPITYMAETDATVLDALLREVNTGEEALQELLAGMADEAGLYIGEAQPVTDVEPQIDKAAELQAKWGTATGQLWQLGDHRLICGDCTDAGVVARVMGGEKAAFCFTDPPYNVGVTYKEETNDNRTRENFVEWCKGWTAHLPERKLLTVGIKRLVWWDDILGDPQWIIAWVKRNGQGQTGLGGTNKWDAVLVYGVKPDHDVDMIEVSNDYSEGIKSQNSHPTAKPVELWAKVIERFSGHSEIVYEPFGGSGTTIIACEQLGRKCRAIEISPNYVAVALERYFQSTGKTPVLVG